MDVLRINIFVTHDMIMIMAATDHLEDFDEVLIIWQLVKKLNWSNTYFFQYVKR